MIIDDSSLFLGIQVQGFMATMRKKRVPVPVYTNPNQLTLDCFQTPFDQKLLKNNRWIVLADQIYCTRANRAWLKERGIMLKAKPLGRPSAVPNHVSPGERNPVEGKFGQAKTGYGLNRIRARLQNTSESWIASIILVLNLVKLAGVALHCLIGKWVVSFSAGTI